MNKYIELIEVLYNFEFTKTVYYDTQVRDMWPPAESVGSSDVPVISLRLACD